MKYLLVIMALSVGMERPAEIKTIEFETKKLCKKAQTILDGEGLTTAHCVQVKE